MSRKSIFSNVLIVFLMVSSQASGVEMRRPLSPEQPMWLVHIDNLYSQDAQLTINAIPEDVRPFVVMNLAVTNPDDQAVLKNYLEVCKLNKIWCMVQNSAGTRNSMSDDDITQYEEFYKAYPNLIGYNFCEQNWGFDATSLNARLELFCNLLELGAQYGGYLYVNDSQSVSNNPINTIAKMKNNSRYAELSKRYADHFIFGDKTTMGYGYYDNESAALGMFLSGHAGHYAIRYDQYSWSYSGRGSVFGTEVPSSSMNNSLAWFSCPEAVMGISIVEHVMMTGATVIDGPEIPTISCILNGRRTPAFKNVICDVVRKVIDGTIVIPSRQEVVERTKVCMVLNQYNTVGDNTPLYEELYQMDGNRENNKTWLKKSGRYGSIPTVATLDDAADFDVVVAQQGTNAYTNRWATTAAKVAELNTLYPEISDGDLYVGRVQEGVYAYNPYLNTDQTTSATIPLQYNTCGSISLTYTPHTFSVIREAADGLSIYLNNYRTDKSALWVQYPNVSYTVGKETYGDNTLPRMTQESVQSYVENTFISDPNHHTLRVSTIKVNGCQSEPVITWKDRGVHAVSSVSKSYAEGTLTLTIRHNGPLEITMKCQGTATDRLPVPSHAAVVAPVAPNMATAIQQVRTTSSATDIYYSIGGVSTRHPSRGIYIQNGKKVIMK